jgi:hypothetical protein
MSIVISRIFIFYSGVAEEKFAARGYGVEQVFMLASRFSIAQLPNYPFMKSPRPSLSS